VYRRKDAFYTRAKTAGYRSRAAFKLLQLTQRYRLFRRGDRVIDLGAWPGGWLQVAARAVGPNGRVVGVDVQRIDPLPEPAVVTVVGDITAERTQARVAALCGGKVDVVLSDLAPKLSGVRARDLAQTQALAQTVLQYAAAVLKPNGALVVKLFTNDDLPRYLAQLRRLFREVRTTRPEATRQASAEIYTVAKGFCGDSMTP
jgi:23S rRNA (uridine2552-2'-O)-methyltransferase